ncbi:MAG: hypothetical protein CFE21_13200 [Bacteroidetes bacterium B1(2017)]|nr:MAG: hypothetical protein CFE21_13200 [Bacteroidetes bacterium B1(2017)]
MTKTLLLLTIYLNLNALMAQDTSYYDTEWQSCDQKNASYSRILKIGKSGYAVKDYYYPSMVIQMTGTYEDKNFSYKKGYFDYYTKEGKQKVHLYYEMGQLNDWQIIFDKEGFFIDSTFFVDGMKEGTRKLYHKNKYLQITETYRNDLLEDTTFTYYPTGKKKRIELYDHNKLVTGYCLDQLGNKIEYTPLFKQPQFPGGQDQLYEWLQSNIVYPKSLALKRIEGRVIISFTIDTTGKPTKYEIVESNDPTFSEATNYLVDLMPNWTPANLDGEKIDFKITLPIKFVPGPVGGLSYDSPSEVIDLYINGEPVLTQASEMPEYIGGYEKMYAYIQANLKYPELALENKIEGNSYVSFIVLSNGDLTDVKAIKKIGWEMDAEAVRIVKSMPKWKPGKMNGEPANVRFTIPVKFQLNN